MAIIEIYTCERTSDIDAIEAVNRHINQNVTTNDYKMEQQITTKRGLVINIKEYDMKKAGRPNFAIFSLVTIKDLKKSNKL